MTSPEIAELARALREAAGDYTAWDKKLGYVAAAALEEVGKDAQRYQWLRQGDSDGPRTRQMQYHHMEHLDEAIDAAISAEGK